MFLGQNHLKEKLKMLEEIRVGIIIAPNNFGKTYFTKEIAKFYGLNYVYIEPRVRDIEMLLSDMSKDTLYHVKDYHKLRHQSISRLLKLLEEGISKENMIIITSDTNFILNTILSRCIVLRFSNYTLEELQEYKKVNEKFYKLYNTPTKLNDIYENINEVENKVNDFLNNPIDFKPYELQDYDIDLIIDLIVFALEDKKKYWLIERIQEIQAKYKDKDYIPNWQKVQLILGMIKDEIT